MGMPFGARGRKSTMALVNGELVVAKRTIKLGHANAIVLPKEWIDAVSRDVEPTVYLITYDTEKLIVLLITAILKQEYYK